MQEEKPEEEGRTVAKPKPMMSFSVEDCQSVSNSAGFECMSQTGDTPSTKFEFRLYRYGETRFERFERKHSIEFSSVAFG